MNKTIKKCLKILFDLDVTKHALRNDGKIAKEILEECDSILKHVFGYKLVAIPEKHQYILVNNIRVDDPKLIDRTPESYQTIGILLPVLAVIFMNNDELKEDEMWKFLAKLGCDVDIKTPINGLDLSIKELLINRWTRQLYLVHEKVPMSDPPEYVFRWGFRAHHEVDKMSILKFVCENYDGEMKPEMWKQQFKRATEMSQ
ncbi:melanoma-associated antigen D2-like protein, partial [Dinothrombium tinctorium]